MGALIASGFTLPDKQISWCASKSLLMLRELTRTPGLMLTGLIYLDATGEFLPLEGGQWAKRFKFSIMYEPSEKFLSLVLRIRRLAVALLVG